MTPADLLAAFAAMNEADRERVRADLDRVPRLRLQVVGVRGVRDPDSPCDTFEPGEPAGDCQTDGHYMCHECELAKLCETCRQIDDRCECPPEPL